MARVEFRHLTPQERLDLIGEIWESLEADIPPLTPAQEAELDHRLATLDEDAKTARDAADVLRDFRRLYRV
jgi:putative addiction module component (TIGR02574 family)